MLKKYLLIVLTFLLLTSIVCIIGCERASITKIYVNQDNPKDYLELRPDGTYYLYEEGIGTTGEWGVRGNELRLSAGGFVVTGEIKGNKIIDDEGKIWVKKSSDFTFNTQLAVEEKAKEQEKAPETQSETTSYQAEPLTNGITVGDFSITLSKIERKDEITSCMIIYTSIVKLHFAIRRINYSKNEESEKFAITARVIDDHGNIYEPIPIRGLNKIAPVIKNISSIPVGFTWAEPIFFEIPDIAPLIKLELYNYDNSLLTTIDLTKHKPILINFDYPIEQKYFVTPGDVLKQGEFLSATVGKFRKNGNMLSLNFDIENSDYNPGSFKAQVGIQNINGEILYSNQCGFTIIPCLNNVEIHGLSKGYVECPIPTNFTRKNELIEIIGEPIKLLIVSKEFDRQELFILRIIPEYFE